MHSHTAGREAWGVRSAQSSDGAGVGLFEEERGPLSSVFWTVDPEREDRPAWEAQELEGPRGIYWEGFS